MKKILLALVLISNIGLFANNLRISDVLNHLSTQKHKKIKLSYNSKDILLPSNIDFKKINTFTDFKKMISSETNYIAEIKNKFSKHKNSIVYLIDKTAYKIANNRPANFNKPMTVSYLFNELKKVNRKNYRVIGDANIPTGNYQIKSVDELIMFLMKNNIYITKKTSKLEETIIVNTNEND